MAALGLPPSLQLVAGSSSGRSVGSTSSSSSTSSITSFSSSRQVQFDLIIGKPCFDPCTLHARNQPGQPWCSLPPNPDSGGKDFGGWILSHTPRLPLFFRHAVPGSKSGADKLVAEQREEEPEPFLGDTGNGRGNFRDSNFGNGGNDGGGGGPEGGGEGEGQDEEKEFGPLLSADEVRSLARGVPLPADMARIAETVGLRKLILLRYLELQEKGLLGAAIRGSALFRNRMLADPAFLFKLATEVAIDSASVTFAEVQKRGKDFWDEFELFLSDLFVGVVLDIALVGLLAPFVQMRAASTRRGIRGSMSRAIQALPSSIFEAQGPGRKFTIPQRGIAFVYKAGQYGLMGFSCGLIGQGVASTMMTLKRKVKKSEEEIAVPDIFQSALLWGGFMAFSSNTRYQILNGLERLVESSAAAHRIPSLSLAFTVGIRFLNNIYGGMQFVDWARLAGVQ